MKMIPILDGGESGDGYEVDSIGVISEQELLVHEIVGLVGRALRMSQRAKDNPDAPVATLQEWNSELNFCLGELSKIWPLIENPDQVIETFHTCRKDGLNLDGVSEKAWLQMLSRPKF